MSSPTDKSGRGRRLPAGTPEAQRALRFVRIDAEAEILHRHYIDSAKKPDHSDANPIFAWAAIGLFMRWGAGGKSKSHPLPEWLSQFLGNIAERVTDFAEMADPKKMPGNSQI